jgi:hypothetical protein
MGAKMTPAGRTPYWDRGTDRKGFLPSWQFSTGEVEDESKKELIIDESKGKIETF